MRMLTRTSTGALAFVIALSLTAAVPASPALGISKNACRVKNTNTGVTKKRLQPAIKAAKNGHVLTVRGVCRGTTVVNKNLTIKGIRPSGASKPTLNGKRSGTTIRIGKDRRVTIKRLTIRGGNGSVGGFCFNPCGGGVWNDGELRLIGASVIDNLAVTGAGIYNLGKVTLMGSTRIRDNISNGAGGGMFNFSTANVKGKTRISDNVSLTDGGGVSNSGTLVLTESSRITKNFAAGAGGGVSSTGGFDPSQCGPGRRVSGNLAGGDCAL